MGDILRPDHIDIAACAVRALTLYSLAEFQAGHATTVYVHAEGASFTVADNGRGHAIGRSVDGMPYLWFVYTHLDYPFGAAQAPTIQPHGIGISLLNSLCSQLSVVARRREATLRMSFVNGVLREEEVLNVESSSTGNTIAGTINPLFQHEGACLTAIEDWLRTVLRATPQLKLYFNDQELHPKRTA